MLCNDFSTMAIFVLAIDLPALHVLCLLKNNGIYFPGFPFGRMMSQRGSAISNSRIGQDEIDKTARAQLAMRIYLVDRVRGLLTVRSITILVDQS